MSHSSQSGQDSVFQRFLHWEAAGSIVLLASAVIALVWANSPWAESYDKLTHTYLGFSIGEDTFKLSLKHWVNDLLMVVFFFVVGLEIKREMLLGELSSFRKAALPVMAAVGGMLVPAGIYLMFNAGGPGQNGWGIPMATDIAFALGILALFGTRAPLGLKVFLTALAIADDMGAVLVIALFYTEEVRLLPLLIAAGCLVLISLARTGQSEAGRYLRSSHSGGVAGSVRLGCPRHHRGHSAGPGRSRAGADRPEEVLRHRQAESGNLGIFRGDERQHGGQ